MSKTSKIITLCIVMSGIAALLVTVAVAAKGSMDSHIQTDVYASDYAVESVCTGDSGCGGAGICQNGGNCANTELYTSSSEETPTSSEVAFAVAKTAPDLSTVKPAVEIPNENKEDGLTETASEIVSGYNENGGIDTAGICLGQEKCLNGQESKLCQDYNENCKGDGRYEGSRQGQKTGKGRGCAR